MLTILRLVKQIEVVDASNGQNPNQPLVRLDSIFYPKNSKTPQARITIFENTPSGTREKQIKIKHGADLSSQINRQDYDGYLVTNINAEPGNEYVEFQNGIVIEVFQESGGMSNERIKVRLNRLLNPISQKRKN